MLGNRVWATFTFFTSVVVFFYKKNNNLPNSTGRVGCDVPHVVDVDWRLDYCLKVCLVGIYQYCWYWHQRANIKFLASFFSFQSVNKE